VASWSSRPNQIALAVVIVERSTDYSGADNLEVMKEAKNYNRFLVKMVVEVARPGDRVVDFGAGIGTFALPMARRGYDLVCIEPDRVQSRGLNTQGLDVLSDLDQIPDASVDYIYTLNVMEHIEDDDAIVAQFQRKMKPDGRLLVYVPAFQLLFSSMDRKVGHFRRYRLGRLVTLLQANGFTIERARYADCIGFAAALVYKLLDRNTGKIDKRMLITYDRFIFPLSCALDLVFGRLLGKNLCVVARKLGSA
jgi:SAM-dependent methyltransferase